MATVKELPDEYTEIHAVSVDLYNLAEKLKDDGYEAGDLYKLVDRLDTFTDTKSTVTEYDDGER